MEGSQRSDKAEGESRANRTKDGKFYGYQHRTTDGQRVSLPLAIHCREKDQETRPKDQALSQTPCLVDLAPESTESPYRVMEIDSVYSHQL